MTENERVREVRKSENLTLEKFGKRIGLGKTAVSKIERGENGVTDQTRISICREFNVSEEWLRTGQDSMYVQLPRNEELAAQVKKFLTVEDGSFRERLVSLLIRLQPEQWEVLEHYARELIDGRSSAPTPTYEQEARAAADEV